MQTAKSKLAEVNVVAGEKIERSGILYVFNIIGTVFQSYWFIVIIALIILVLIIYLIISKIHGKRKKRREMLSITAISDARKV